mgnify:CR=1 FL=1
MNDNALQTKIQLDKLTHQQLQQLVLKQDQALRIHIHLLHELEAWYYTLKEIPDDKRKEFDGWLRAVVSALGFADRDIAEIVFGPQPEQETIN